MSLYQKTWEEIFDFLQKNYSISDETKNKLKDEYIDGEVLFELNDEDFNFFEFKPFTLKSIKFNIYKEKKSLNKFKEQKKEELVNKLKTFGIDDPDKLLDSNIENIELKIGQKKLLDKYKKIINLNKININSNDFDILKYLKDEIGLSEESIRELDGITKDYLFKMEEDEINQLNIDEKDKNKLKN